MDMRVMPSEIGGSIEAVASKSEAHRLLICSAFADAPTKISCNTSSQDIDATVDCLRALGAQVTRTPEGFEVAPAGDPTPGALLDCGESGSTERFLLPIACVLGRGAALTGRGRLAARPLSPLYEELEAHGAELSPQGAFPLEVSGKAAGGRYTIAGNVSSQFISGLLMAAPLAGEAVEVFVTAPVESLPYIDITCAAMAEFGVEVARRKHEEAAEGGMVSGLLFSVARGSRYHTPGKVRVGGDWSNAAFWLAAGALNPAGIEVKGLDLRSHQGDRAILGALALLGARVERGEDSVCVSPDVLRGCRLDVHSCPDLVPPLAAVAALAQGTTAIVGAGRLRIKESDRLQTVSDAVNALGGRVTQTDDGLRIEGVGSLAGGTVDAANDHRIAMMSAVLASTATGPTTIRGAQCVAKSYPAFFEDLSSLGGTCKEA